VAKQQRDVPRKQQRGDCVSLAPLERAHQPGGAAACRRIETAGVGGKETGTWPAGNVIEMSFKALAIRD
jgi:hypothetical protein